MNYCNTYDDAAPILNTFIGESEIHFDVGDTEYIVDMWAGKYGPTIGGEVGIYKTTPSCSNDEVLKTINNFAYYASDTPIGINYQLVNNNKELFSVNSKKYGNESGTMTWLAAFQDGNNLFKEYNLSMNATLTLPNKEMSDHFVSELEKTKDISGVIYDPENFTVSYTWTLPKPV